MSQTQVLRAIKKCLLSNDKYEAILTFFVRYNFYHLKLLNDHNFNVYELRDLIEFYDIVLHMHNSSSKLDLIDSDVSLSTKQLLRFLNHCSKLDDIHIIFQLEFNPLMTVFRFLKTQVTGQIKGNKYLLSGLMLISNLIPHKQKPLKYYNDIGEYFSKCVELIRLNNIIDNKLSKLICSIYISIGKLSLGPFPNNDDGCDFVHIVGNLIGSVSRSLLDLYKSKRNKTHLLTDWEIKLFNCISNYYYEIVTPVIKVECLEAKSANDILVNYLQFGNQILETYEILDIDCTNYVIKLMYAGISTILTELRMECVFRDDSNKLLVNIILNVIKVILYTDNTDEFYEIKPVLKNHLSQVFDALPIETYRYSLILTNFALTIETKMAALYVLYALAYFCEPLIALTGMINNNFFQPIDEFLLDLHQVTDIKSISIKCVLLLHSIRYDFFVHDVDWKLNSNHFLTNHFIKQQNNIESVFSYHPSVISWILCNPILINCTETILSIFQLCLNQSNPEAPRILINLVLIKPQLFALVMELIVQNELAEQISLLSDSILMEPNGTLIDRMWDMFFAFIQRHQSYLLNEHFMKFVEKLLKSPPRELRFPIVKRLGHMSDAAPFFKEPQEILEFMAFILVCVDVLVSNFSWNMTTYFETLLNLTYVNEKLIDFIFNSSSNFIREKSLDIIIKLQGYQTKYNITCQKPYEVNKITSFGVENETSFLGKLLLSVTYLFDCKEKNIGPLFHFINTQVYFDLLIAAVNYVKLDIDNKMIWNLLIRILKYIRSNGEDAAILINNHFRALFQFICENKLFKKKSMETFINFYVNLVQNITDNGSQEFNRIRNSYEEMFKVDQFAINIGDNLNEVHCEILYSKSTAFVWIGAKKPNEKPPFNHLVYAIEGSNANSTLSSTIFNTDDSDDNDINGLAKRLTERLHVPILISFHKNFDMLAATVLNLNQTQPKGHLNSASSANIVMYTIELAVYEKLKDLIKSSNVLVI